MDFFNLKKEIVVLKRDIKEAFKRVREESDVHLDSINDNTNEIQLLYGMFSEFDEKLNKMSEKIEKLYLILENVGLIKKSKEFKQIKLSELTRTERDVYQILFNNEKELSLLEISHISGLDFQSIKDALSMLIKRSVPIIQKFIDGESYFCLEKEFKEKMRNLSMVVEV